tara:strand:- start:164 stop:316 length:153 start_codon:yes stop_codon:yes gene_type:complete
MGINNAVPFSISSLTFEKRLKIKIQIIITVKALMKNVGIYAIIDHNNFMK